MDDNTVKEPDDVMRLINDETTAIPKDNLNKTFDIPVEAAKAIEEINGSSLSNKDDKQDFFDSEIGYNDHTIYIPNLIFNDACAVDASSIDITDAEKELFFRSILLNAPIELKISLLGNKIDIGISSINKELEVLLKDFSKYQNLSQYDMQLLFMAFMLKTINGKPELQEFNISNLNWVLDSMHKWVKSISVEKYDLIKNALRIFEHKIYLLSISVNDPDFWKPLN